MRLASYTIGGRSTFGIVVDDAVIDLGRRVKWPTLRELIAADPTAAAEYAGERPDYALSEVTLMPPIPEPGMIICLGLNTYSHLREYRELNGADAPPPAKPWVFLRSSRSIAAHGQDLVRPNASPLFDFEGEIALIIGKHARHVPPEKALDHAFGYACFNEGSIRDFQLHSPLYTAGKNFPRSGSFGPWIVTADEIADIGDFSLTTRLNGAVVQEMKYDDLIFGFPEMISYISSFTELHPGDVIVTGTAAGVGGMRKPPLWMVPGDNIEVEVTGLGVLRNKVVDAQGSDRGPITCDDPAAAVEAARALMKK
jgi:2-keto-4-pentenoate hydratase/2-oxohepta-3-ene-1,7-dioic acid hydratase in catechol pathway